MFYKYILELKNRLFLSCFSWFITFIVCYNYKKTLLFLLIKLNIKLYHSESFYFITTNLTDVFNVYIKICCFISNQFFIIYLIYNCLLFISPGLFYYEYKNLKLIVLFSLFLNCVNIVAFNSLFLPYLWSFFLSYFENNVVENINIFFEIQITDYFLFYINTYYILILISQLFLIIFMILFFISNKINVIKTTRKLTYAIFLIFSTIITPPDVISQVILTIFFILLYEIIINLIFFKIVIKINFM